MLNRRFFSKSLILSLSFFSMGHAPWGQWQVYRMRHMLILSVIEDKNSYPFSKKIIDSLEKTLPESRARPARARGFRRVYSLLSTDQMPLVVLSKDIADDMADCVTFFPARLDEAGASRATDSAQPFKRNRDIISPKIFFILLRLLYTNLYNLTQFKLAIMSLSTIILESTINCNF